ncbi:MAG: N-6 DNA methylase [Verrucomicrobia bacterium]|nr:N-6 DNA methylase [Verrucomicrobiota bacterium]
MNRQTTTISRKALVDAHRKGVPAGLLFYGSPAEMKADSALTPYLHVLIRAWDDLELSGVLCVDGLPTLYLAVRSKPISPSDGADLQRLFWNQGVATVLAVADPTTVRVYSGLAKPTQADAATGGEIGLVEALNLADYAVNVRTFLLRLATGSYYRANAEHFSPEQAVDAYLLNNLRKLCDKLVESNSQLTVEKAHTFLARVLFACYLIDREIIDLGDYTACRCSSKMSLGQMLNGLSTAEEKRHALHGLFGQLKEDFNGSMFERATLTACRELRSSALQNLTDFLQGHELGTGQYTLDFWAYDFRYIQVETISAVYEDFLKREDEPEKRAKGAYYTPRFLAETVIDLAIPAGETLEGKRFLDPACGSGIFLVTLFNRMATTWEAEHTTLARDYGRKADALKAILRDQLCGIDVNPTACRIACFSLYLAFLDRFDPPDIQGYVRYNGKLPSILLHRDPNAGELPTFPVIREDDFLVPTHKLPEAFDYVVGNPPWEGRGATNGKHHQFARKVPDHLAEGAVACLLLPSKTFLNDKTNQFQGEWLRAVTVEEVVQLADYRKVLFKEAKCPCMIVRFREAAPDLEDALIEYSVPKVTHIDRRDGIIPVAPADRKFIPLRRVLAAANRNAAPAVWKQHLWGTPRDVKLLDLLQQMPQLGDIAGEPREKLRWVKGEGFQPYYPEKAKRNKNYPAGKGNPWGQDTLFVNARYFPSMFLLQDDCNQLGKALEERNASTTLLRRSPSEQLFEAPLVLVSQGIGEGGFPKVAFCDTDAVFQDSLQAISGPAEDEDLLIFLAVYLRSKLAKYFLFNVAANWGTERDKMLLTELLSLPFALPGCEFLPANAGKILKKIAHQVKSLKRRMLTSQPVADDVLAHHQWADSRLRETGTLQLELDPLVFEYFGLMDQEIMLVEDCVDIVIPSATPASLSAELRTRAPIQKNNYDNYSDGLSSYAETLGNTLNEWAEQAQSKVRVSISGGVHESSDMACLTAELTADPQPFKEEPPSDEAFFAVAGLAESLSSRAGCLDYLRGIIAFDGPSIHIFKPTALIGWTRTAALNDAAEIYARIADARNAMREVDA